MTGCHGEPQQTGTLLGGSFAGQMTGMGDSSDKCANTLGKVAEHVLQCLELLCFSHILFDPGATCNVQQTLSWHATIRMISTNPVKQSMSSDIVSVGVLHVDLCSSD